MVFEDALKKAVSDGSLSGPLAIAAKALLFGNYFRGQDEGVAAQQASAQATSQTGGSLLDGLGGLLQKFQQAGLGGVIDSWIGSGQNQSIHPGSLGQVLGSQTISDLAGKAGVDSNNLLDILSRNLPEIINSLTPKGRMPTPEEDIRQI